jgi:transposase
MEKHIRTTQSNNRLYYTVAKQMTSLLISLDSLHQYKIFLFFTYFYQWLQLSQDTKHESKAKCQLLKGTTDYI